MGSTLLYFPRISDKLYFQLGLLITILKQKKIKGPYERHTGTSIRQRNTYVGALECLKAPPGAICA